MSVSPKVPPPRFDQPDALDLHLEELSQKESTEDAFSRAWLQMESTPDAECFEKPQADDYFDENYYGP